MNIILAGDFAQLPPISQYTLYSGIQEATIGKAAWHQFTMVVILRENMRQTTQTPEDGKLRRALQNMRYKACTAADISFLKTLVGGRPAKKVCNISIIVGPNAHRDKYNMLGLNRYANDTKQPLHHFYSMDTLGNISRARVKDPRRASNVLSPELQHVMWNLPHEASQHCAGKISICHGMPVLVKHNIATPCCVTNGAEGTVVGWKCSRLTKDKRVLDVLFVKLKNPPVPIHLDGLPLNVVPIGRAAQDIICRLPNDDTLTITRQQVQVLPNFSMTDYGCQGRTQPNNVVDLGGCLTHQSYYTSLSRSASASGTPNKIMGGASGWLRQEFRELEILDEINKLRYEKKLPTNITGDRRNTIIRESQTKKVKLSHIEYINAQGSKPLLQLSHDSGKIMKTKRLYELEDLDEMPM
ncbi:hypothetical protein K439DRAFT_1644957 [Ramaria rubella]|nr:hypothetical protein K439DRAFT_1644957 [Ramaria rubella]